MHLQAYLDYYNTVGGDDNGKMMSEKEFEAYLAKVSESRKNHLYVHWTNEKGYDCKAIGPDSMCFCGHRFKRHNFDNIKTKKVDCKENCKCPLFEYVPVHGSNDIKCLCKHSYSLHDNKSRKCTKSGCLCKGFGSKFTCNCGLPFDDHKTFIKTREERQAMGKQVDPAWMAGNLVAGVGGLNSFTDMVKDEYAAEYQEFLPDVGDKNNMLPSSYGYKGALKAKEEVSTKGTSMSAYDLFVTPHSLGVTSGIKKIKMQ